MSLETMNLLIGAGIALLSSLITSILTNLFQRKNNEQKRNWDIEDSKRSKRYQIGSERLKQAEHWAEASVKFFNETRVQLISLKGNLSDGEEFRKWMKKILETPSGHLEKGILYRVNDEELLRLSAKIGEFWNKMAKLLTTKSSGDEIVDVIGFSVLINNEFEDVVKLHGEFLKRVDQLKTELYTD